MKYKGVIVTYYLNNGTVITDDGYVFTEPLEANSEELTKFKEKISSITDLVFNKAKFEGKVVIGTVYVRVSSINAIRIKYVEDSV